MWPLEHAGRRTWRVDEVVGERVLTKEPQMDLFKSVHLSEAFMEPVHNSYRLWLYITVDG